MRTLTFVLLGSEAIACMMTQSERARASKQETAWVEVDARADWYAARPEREQTWEGSLQERKSAASPGGRGGLSLSLVSKHAEIPVYTAGDGKKLKRFLARQVRVRGKLVDLSNEGFGKELWIGYVQPTGRQH